MDESAIALDGKEEEFRLLEELEAKTRTAEVVQGVHGAKAVGKVSGV